jgi:transposase InsO family protein
MSYLLKTPHDARYLITVIDYCTSHAITWTLKECSGTTAAEILKEIIWEHEKSAEIIIDNNEEFKDSEFQAILKKYDIKHNWISSDYSQTNDKIERLNHELIQCLKWITIENGKALKDWDFYVR